MADERAPAGQITPPIRHHLAWRQVWVHIGARRFEGREEATAQDGKARLCRWAEDGIGQYGWLWERYVEDRHADDPSLG